MRIVFDREKTWKDGSFGIELDKRLKKTYTLKVKVNESKVTGE